MIFHNFLKHRYLCPKGKVHPKMASLSSFTHFCLFYFFWNKKLDVSKMINLCSAVFQQAHDGPAGHALCEVPPEPVWPHHRARHHQQKPCEVQTQRPHRSARGWEDPAETERHGGQKQKDRTADAWGILMCNSFKYELNIAKSHLFI